MRAHSRCRPTVSLPAGRTQEQISHLEQLVEANHQTSAEILLGNGPGFSLGGSGFGFLDGTLGLRGGTLGLLGLRGGTLGGGEDAQASGQGEGEARHRGLSHEPPDQEARMAITKYSHSILRIHLGAFR